MSGSRPWGCPGRGHGDLWVETAVTSESSCGDVRIEAAGTSGSARVHLCAYENRPLGADPGTIRTFAFNLLKSGRCLEVFSFVFKST